MSRIFGENHYTTGGEAGVRKMSNLWTKRAFAGLTYSRLVVAGLAFVAVLAAPAQAQNDRMTPIATPVAAQCGRNRDRSAARCEEPGVLA